MGNKWLKESVIDLQNRGILLVEDGNHGESRPRPDEFCDTGVAFIRAADMDCGRVLFGSAEKINTHARQRITKGIGKPGDVIISHKGTVGKVALVLDDAPPFVCSPQTTFWRTTNEKVLDRNYLYAYLRSPLFHSQLAARAGETDMAPYVSLTSQRALLVTIPPIGVQHAIATILSSLDDKIELNRRTCETLEEMARAIFKSWFVDFDPVRAKMAGEKPASICKRLGLTQEMLEFFPNMLVDSELGEIPEGWAIGSISQGFDITMGQSPPGSTYNESEDGIPFFQGCTDFNARFPTRRVYCTAPTRYAHKGDTLISVRAPVGTINMAIEECSIGRGLASILHKTHSRTYTYFFMKSHQEDFQQFESNGTVFGSMGKDDFACIKCIHPSESIINKFEDLILPSDSAVENCEMESIELARIRDTILPKLISGELEVG